jgi:hypothetical protein
MNDEENRDELARAAALQVQQDEEDDDQGGRLNQSDDEDGDTHVEDDIPPLDIDQLLSGGTSTKKETAGSKMNWMATAVSEEEVETNTILVPKNSRGTYGSRDYLRNMDAATTPLEPKLGVPSHFVSSRDGEAESGNQTKHQFIQEVFVSNNEKLEQAMLRVENYDMMSIFMVPAVKRKSAKRPEDIFDLDATTNMFVHWDSLTWKQVCLWQQTINRWASEEDRTSSRWAQSFLYKSSTSDLRERVDSQYKSLPVSCKGGVIYLYLQLRIMFHMSRDTIQALKKYIKLFEEKGLRRIRGENVVVAKKELKAVCTRLKEVNALPDETVVDILEGLTNCSVPEFTKLFDFLLQAARADALDLNNLDEESDDTLGQVKHILSKAVDSYHALCTAGKWHVNHKRASLIVCWNCGEEGHRCEKCPKPTNQSNIDASKKKWQESNKGSGGGSGGSGGGKLNQQQRKKWGHPDAPKDGGGIRWFNGTPKAWCGKKDSNGSVCGWNTDHSTAYHGREMKNPSSFVLADLSPSHPLVVAQKGRGGGSTKPPSGTSNPGSHGEQILLNKSQANDVLTKLENNANSEETAAIVGALRNLLCLN